MIHMSHSIPDARAVALHTDLGAILVTGDYRFDQTPVDGRPADIARLAELGSEGVLCLCGDSTNADRPGVVRLGGDRRPGAARRVLALRGPDHRHLLRLQRAPRAAGDRRRRRSSTAGSRWSAARCARTSTSPPTSGSPTRPSGLLISPKEIEDFPDHKVIAISTGSQGEPLSALRRMAFNDHRDVELHSGDTVIFSATPIPGNERSVNETIDRIYEIGARVVTAADAPIHVSGHGSREELKLMLNLTRPQHVFPFHGDHKRIHLHAELAESVGIEPERIHKGRNGLPLEIDADGARFGEPIEAGMIFVDGVDIGDPDDVALRDRRMLSADGDVHRRRHGRRRGRQLGGAARDHLPRRAVPRGRRGGGCSRSCATWSRPRWRTLADEGVTEPVLLQQDLHDDIAAFVYDRLRRRPMILPVVVEV